MPHAEIPLDEQRRGSAESSVSSGSPRRAIHPVLELDRTRSNSTNSSLGGMDHPDFDEDNFQDNFPNRPYLLPIVVPTEPTLDELLKRVTGREDLQNVESIKLRVISYMVSLSRLSTFMPRLTSLDLDGSVVSSLRDLGCGLTCLTFLNVSNCGLTSLDGTNGIPTVVELVADGNMIEIVSPLGNLTQLRKLSLRDNRIRDLGALSFLGLCPIIKEVNLEGNPVTTKLLYRKDMKKNIPTLELLDGKYFEEGTMSPEPSPELSGTESTSSLSDAQSERESDMDIDNNIATFSGRQRPVTSHDVCQVTIRDDTDRPSSADKPTTRRPLTSGQPVCGSVITTARQQRKQQVRSAWGYSSSSSDSYSSIENYNERIFPNQLPQSSVDLELGVVGVSGGGGSSSSETESNGSLVELARRWRNECQRKQHWNDDA